MINSRTPPPPENIIDYETIFKSITGQESFDEISAKIDGHIEKLIRLELIHKPSPKEIERRLMNEYWRKRGINPSHMEVAREKLEEKDGGSDKLRDNFAEVRDEIKEIKLLIEDKKTELNVGLEKLQK